jgi:long-chain acyl-CoA synthetase
MPPFVVAFFGALIAGARVVNLSFLTSPSALAFQLRDAAVDVLITADPTLPSSEAVKGVRAVVLCREDDLTAQATEPNSFAALLREAQQPPSLGAASLTEDVILLQYTGGSTGAPKAAMLTHANVCASVDIRNRSAGDVPGGADKTLLVTPLSHVSGLSSVLLCAVDMGMPMVMHRRFDPGDVLKDVAEKRITILSLVPSMYALLVDHPDIGKFDLSSLRRCTSTGGPLPARVARKFLELTGLPLLERYGCTEAAPAVASQVVLGKAVPGTVGLPEPNTLVEIRDPTDGIAALPPGVPGEICVRGPQVMKGYWNRPEETARALQGGFLHTGDLGAMDEQGFLTLTGRLKEIIFCGGFNIYPKNIEDALNEHPAVAEAAVIGVPDTYLMEVPKAFVVLRPLASGVTSREIRRFIAAKLSKHEVPAAIEIRESLPKTAAGKISKRDILAALPSPVDEQR